MARRVVLSDDFTGNESEDVSTVTFAYRGQNYEIDLGNESQDKMDAAFTPFIMKARAITNLRALQKGNVETQKRDRETGASIREWARANGHEISERGRIPEEIVTAYNEAAKAAEAKKTLEEKNSNRGGRR